MYQIIVTEVIEQVFENAFFQKISLERSVKTLGDNCHIGDYPLF